MTLLLWTALTLALVHTLIGPDHYLPFVVLARAEGWSLRKALVWTSISGVAHVLSSVVLGGVGIAVGWAIGGMEAFEAVRGEVASYGLIGFGLLYAVWGMWRARRSATREGGRFHHHAHGDEHAGPGQFRRTPWVLLIIFVLGPCEPLIPLLMVPAAEHSIWGIASVVVVFGGVTVATMLTVVTLCLLGLQRLRFGALERHVHAVAGLTLFLSGFLVKALGI